VPEIQELQTQLASAHEQLSDLQFSAAADKAAAAQAAQDAAKAYDELSKQLQVSSFMIYVLLCGCASVNGLRNLSYARRAVYHAKDQEGCTLEYVAVICSA
jgi:hypothetical protein